MINNSKLHIRKLLALLIIECAHKNSQAQEFICENLFNYSPIEGLVFLNLGTMAQAQIFKSKDNFNNFKLKCIDIQDQFKHQIETGNYSKYWVYPDGKLKLPHSKNTSYLRDLPNEDSECSDEFDEQTLKEIDDLPDPQTTLIAFYVPFKMFEETQRSQSGRKQMILTAGSGSESATNFQKRMRQGKEDPYETTTENTDSQPMIQKAMNDHQFETNLNQKSLFKLRQQDSDKKNLEIPNSNQKQKVRKNLKVKTLISSLNENNSDQVSKQYFSTKNSHTPYSANKKISIVSVSQFKHKKTVSEIGSVERSSKIGPSDKRMEQQVKPSNDLNHSNYLGSQHQKLSKIVGTSNTLKIKSVHTYSSQQSTKLKKHIPTSLPQEEETKSLSSVKDTFMSTQTPSKKVNIASLVKGNNQNLKATKNMITLKNILQNSFNGGNNETQIQQSSKPSNLTINPNPVQFGSQSQSAKHSSGVNMPTFSLKGKLGVGGQKKPISKVQIKKVENNQ